MFLRLSVSGEGVYGNSTTILRDRAVCSEAQAAKKVRHVRRRRSLGQKSARCPALTRNNTLSRIHRHSNICHYVYEASTLASGAEVSLQNCCPEETNIRTPKNTSGFITIRSAANAVTCLVYAYVSAQASLIIHYIDRLLHDDEDPVTILRNLMHDIVTCCLTT